MSKPSDDELRERAVVAEWSIAEAAVRLNSRALQVHIKAVIQAALTRVRDETQADKVIADVIRALTPKEKR